MGLNSYKETHIGTYRYRCKKTDNGYPIHQKGNYESLLSFKELPKYKELKKNGRKWIYTKHYQPVMDRIILDIDCEDGLEQSYKITNAILTDFSDIQDTINIYFSGSKGFHIEILTEELDIIDTSVEKPMDSCYQYVEFLNYYQDKYQEVDLSLKDVGTRIIRIHHTKHEKTGNYKILVDINASLDTILASSKSDKDMVEPAKDILGKEKALLLLNTFSKPVEHKSKFMDTEIETESIKADISIFAKVFNELNTNIHNKIFLIGSGLNGYVNNAEMEEIYTYLAKTTDIEDSINAKGSFIDAYENDNKPCNLGLLYKHYQDKDLDLTNFYELSYYLDSKVQTKDYNQFNDILESYNYNWFRMLDTELYDYVDNTKNIFKGIINSLMAEYGYGSRFIGVNAGSEVGKSEYIKAIKKLMPKFKNLGSSTPASIRRQNQYAFDKNIVYLGDKGLKGKSQNAKDEFEGLYEVFGGLITENEFVRDVVVGDKIMEFNLKSDGVCVFYSEPYTNLRVFGAGDQYTTRTTFITLNPVEDGLAVFLQDESRVNEFYNIHRNYIKYILKHPIKVNITNDVKTELYYASRNSLRTAKYLLGLFKAYCQYLQIENPLKLDVEEFLKVFRPQLEVSEIEFMIYKKLYNNLNVLTADGLDYMVAEDGSVEYGDILLQSKERKDKSFFTAKQIKTYFKTDFKHNKNLKDTIDLMADILHNLYNAGYLEKLEWQYNGQNVYYLPYNEDMD